MKREVQEPGVRKWFGNDLTSLQGEPLKALDAMAAAFGKPYAVDGVALTKNGSLYNVSAGIVALPDGSGGYKVMPFAGVQSVALPIYLKAKKTVVDRPYKDGVSRAVAENYEAEATTVKPADGTFMQIGTTGAPRLADVMQDAAHRMVTDQEKTAWNAKETPAGAQDKADAVRTGLLGNAPADRDTLGKLSDAVDSLKVYADGAFMTPGRAEKLYMRVVCAGEVRGGALAQKRGDCTLTRTSTGAFRITYRGGNSKSVVTVSPVGFLVASVEKGENWFDVKLRTLDDTAVSGDFDFVMSMI